MEMVDAPRFEPGIRWPQAWSSAGHRSGRSIMAAWTH